MTARARALARLAATRWAMPVGAAVALEPAGAGQRGAGVTAGATAGRRLEHRPSP